MKKLQVTESMALVQECGNYHIAFDGRKIPLMVLKPNEDIVQIRKEHPITSVFKLKDLILYTHEVIPNAMAHRCRSCRHCYASPDEEGGCAKVRDRLVERIELVKEDAVEKAKRIEKYPFIELGFQTPRSFLVFSCKNYAKDGYVSSGAAINTASLLKKKHGLAQFIAGGDLSKAQFIAWHNASYNKREADITPVSKFPTPSHVAE